MTSLFEPVDLLGQTLSNRVVMAPMTRARAAQPGDLPTAMTARYYGQRAGAGLIVTEATHVDPLGKGTAFAPGIHTAAQVAGWHEVTKAVHAGNGRIVAQLGHAGRVSHPDLLGGARPVAPSALAPGAQVWVPQEDGSARMRECPVPRALTTDEVARLVDRYASAALNAVAAGFDGVEIQAGAGQLVDQFLCSGSNHRSDRYGGSTAHRARFLHEVVRAVSEIVGAQRVGVRFSPFLTAKGMQDEDVMRTTLAAVAGLDVAYVHLAEADGDTAPPVPLAFRRLLREQFDGAIVVTGGYTAERAQVALQSGLVDLVGFGRAFIANPDLPQRLRHGWPLAEVGDAPVFGHGRDGYTTFCAYDEELAAL